MYEYLQMITCYFLCYELLDKQVDSIILSLT